MTKIWEQMLEKDRALMACRTGLQSLNDGFEVAIQVIPMEDGKHKTELAERFSKIRALIADQIKSLDGIIGQETTISESERAIGIAGDVICANGGIENMDQAARLEMFLYLLKSAEPESMEEMAYLGDALMSLLWPDWDTLIKRYRREKNDPRPPVYTMTFSGRGGDEIVPFSASEHPLSNRIKEIVRVVVRNTILRVGREGIDDQLQFDVLVNYHHRHLRFLDPDRWTGETIVVYYTLS
jgi:hypothetical protein